MNTTFIIPEELDPFHDSNSDLFDFHDFVMRNGYDELSGNELEDLCAEYEEKIYGKLESLLQDCVDFDLSFNKYDGMLGLVFSTNITEKDMLEILYNDPGIMEYVEGSTFEEFLTASVKYFVDEYGWNDGEILIEIYEDL